MSINTWTPEKPSSENNLSVNLNAYIELGKLENIEQAVANLTYEQVENLTPLMKMNIEYWHNAAKNYSSPEIIYLMRFLTVAEEKNSQLFAGKQSPVIALNKLLKKRNEPLSKEELLWIKAHSTNRFLPNGSVL